MPATNAQQPNHTDHAELARAAADALVAANREGDAIAARRAMGRLRRHLDAHLDQVRRERLT